MSERDWRAYANCLGVDPDLFFPPRGTNDVSEARRVCAGCQVADACRDWGVRHEKHGIWGGMTEQERRRARRKLGIRLVAPSMFRLCEGCGSPFEAAAANAAFCSDACRKREHRRGVA